LDLLASAVARGDAHVCDIGGESPPIPERWGWHLVAKGSPAERWEPRGKTVGWVDGQFLYLDAESAYAVVQELGSKGGEAVTVGVVTLKKRLYEKGLLARIERTQGKVNYAIRETISGRRRRVLALRVAALGEPEPESGDFPAVEIEPDPNDWPTFVGQWPPAGSRVGHGSTVSPNDLPGNGQLGQLSQPYKALGEHCPICGNADAVPGPGGPLACPKCGPGDFVRAVKARLEVM
jgi:hypothetical protein